MNPRPGALANVPRRAPAPMRPQPLEVWTPFSLLGRLAGMILWLPRRAVAMPATVARLRRA